MAVRGVRPVRALMYATPSWSAAAVAWRRSSTVPDVGSASASSKRRIASALHSAGPIPAIRTSSSVVIPSRSNTVFSTALRAAVSGDRLVPAPDGVDYSLAIVHTLHPGVDYSWVAACPLVLDSTYQLDGVPHRAVV